MAETESYKQERERERARDSMAHCPLLEKATGSGPSTVSFLYFLRRKRNDSKIYFLYARRSNIVPAADEAMPAMINGCN